MRHPSQRGEEWAVSYRSRGIDLASVRHIDEGRLEAATARGAQTTGGRGIVGRELFDEDFRGELGNLPPATQTFIQQPFLSDQPLEWDYRTTRSPKDDWIAEHVWCWVIGSRYLSFVSAERWAFTGRSVGFSDARASAALALQPWQLQGRLAAIDRNRVVDTRLGA
jgi:hypothetical protein